MNSPSEFGALLRRNAELKAELAREKTKTNAKTISIVTVAVALAGSPGFWMWLNPPPPPPPPTVSAAEFSSLKNTVDMIATDVSEIKLQNAQDITSVKEKVANLERFADRYTPGNRARLPR